MSRPQKFRKKPVEVEAMQLVEGSLRAVAVWMVESGYAEEPDRDLADYDPRHIHDGKLLPECGTNFVEIATTEGEMTAMVGDWIIRGTRGEFYPCKPGPFADTFEVIA